jgi:hypothetical protein
MQSLTADYYSAGSRGRAFGMLWLTISFGGMLGALYATNVGALTPLGIEGWWVWEWRCGGENVGALSYAVTP